MYKQSLILTIDQRAPVWEYKLLGAKQLRGEPLTFGKT